MVAAVTGWLVKETRIHGKDRVAKPGKAAPQRRHQKHGALGNDVGGCQPLQRGGKGMSCIGETEERATRAASAAAKRHGAPSGTHMGQVVTHIRASTHGHGVVVTHTGVSTHGQGEQ